MKLVLLALSICILLSACASPKTGTPCQSINTTTVEGQWLMAQCYEEHAISEKNITYCDYIGKEYSSPLGLRIYSKATCKNLYEYKLAIASHDSKHCELINQNAALYAQPPQDANIKTSLDLKESCRDNLMVIT